MLPLWGQEQARWIVGLEGGSAVYQGDISKGGFGTLRGETYVWGGSLQYRPRLFWSLGLQAHRGNLRAEDAFFIDDDYRIARRFHFSTVFTDVALLGRFYPLGKLATMFQPQIGIGLGVLFFDPTPDLFENTHFELSEFIKADVEADFAKQVLFIPLRLGLGYQFSTVFSMEVGLQYNFAQTDFLDGVSQAGNPRNKDRYGHIYLGAAVHLGIASDIDLDGVADSEDSCPLKPGTVATQGCPDADQDGIRDSEDRCPYAAGNAIMEGCPDTDQDGIMDPYDRCPALAGPAEALGCPPRDHDGDGVLDHQDDCPLEKGPVGRRGCPAIDSDLDGLLDEDDRCPDHFGIALFSGCPDTDGDGIEDYNDSCPNTLGDFAYGGCPQIATPQEEADLLSQQILHFRVNSADLFNYPLLDRMVQFLLRYPSYRLNINGHADIGIFEEAPAYLSQLRAERVKRYLMDSGVPKLQLLVRGFSNRKPLYTDSSPARRYLNRRVVFRLQQGNW